MRWPDGSVLVVTGYKYLGATSPVSPVTKADWPIGKVFAPSPNEEDSNWVINVRQATEEEQAAWRLGFGRKSL